MSHIPQPANHLTEDEIFSMPVVNPSVRSDGVGDGAVEEDNILAQWPYDFDILEDMDQILLMNSMTGVFEDEAVDHHEEQTSDNLLEVHLFPDSAGLIDSHQIWSPHELAQLEVALEQVVKDSKVRRRKPSQGGASSTTKKSRPVPLKPKEPKRKTAKPTVRRPKRGMERKNPVVSRTTYGWPEARTMDYHNSSSPLNSVLQHPFGLLTPGIAFKQPNMYAVLNRSVSDFQLSKTPVLQAQIKSPMVPVQGQMSGLIRPSPAPEQVLVDSHPTHLNRALFGQGTVSAMDSIVTATTEIEVSSETFWLQVLAANGGLGYLKLEYQVFNDPNSSSDSFKQQIGFAAQRNATSSPPQAQYLQGAAADPLPELQHGFDEYDVALLYHLLACDVKGST